MSFATIAAAITSLKVAGSAKGVSREAIKGKLGDVSAARVNVGLKKAVAAGKLIQVKGSYKLAPPKARPKTGGKKKPAPKKPAAKKKGTKKKGTKKKLAPKKTTCPRRRT